MKAYSLIGHQRPLTFLKYNYEGNLLFSCAKDSLVTLWMSHNGSPVGVYRGHRGVVYQCDITHDSNLLVTASSDSTLRVWEVKTGKQLNKLEYNEPCRAISLSLGDELLVATTDAFINAPSRIHVVRMNQDTIEKNPLDKVTIDVDSGRITRAFFHDVNRQLITAHENGSLRRWDVETGEHLQTTLLHENVINDLKLSEDSTHLITASTDKKSKLVDLDSFETIGVYQSKRPVNSADFSPIFEHILLGGGQDVAEVTNTSVRVGEFGPIFFHKIFNEQLESFRGLRGHFGPINTVAFAPDGRSFSSGGEDGNIRVHHLGGRDISFLSQSKY